MVRKMTLGLAILAGVALFFQGCAVSSTNEVVKPGVQKGGFMGLSKNAEVIVDQPKVLAKQSNKVIVGSFKVGFIVEGRLDAVAKGGFFSGSVSQGKATAKAHLKGLEPAQMQKFTNDIYLQFISQLKSKGYTVLGADELSSDSDYTALQQLGKPAPQDNIGITLLGGGKVNYYAPDTMNVVFFIGERSGFDLSMETIKKAQTLSEKTAANVLAVNYIVNFSGGESHGGFTMSASVRVGQSLRIITGSGIVSYQGSKSSPVNIKLGQAVSSEDQFCTIENVTSGVEKGVRIASNVASALLGGGTSQSEDYNFTIDPEKYSVAIQSIGNKANEKLITKMAEALPQSATEPAAPAAPAEAAVQK